MMTSQWRHTVIPLMVPLRIRWWQLKVYGGTFWKEWIKNYQRSKGKRGGQGRSSKDVSVSAKLCYTQYLWIFSGNWVEFDFFSFFNCFAIFVTISVFLFIFWFVYCWFLFRYWRHWPIHVESELIKHLSRFSSSSFSEFLYQKDCSFTLKRFLSDRMAVLWSLLEVTKSTRISARENLKSFDRSFYRKSNSK